MSNVYSLDQVRAARAYELASAEWEGAPAPVVIVPPADFATEVVAEARGWLEHAAFGFFCFAMGMLFTAALALVLAKVLL